MNINWIKKAVANVILLAASISIVVLSVEMTLRLTDLKTLLVKNYLPPQFYYMADSVIGFDNSNNFPPAEFVFSDDSFKVWTNELGCFDRPYRNEKEYILLLGDSFTWGFAPFESLWGSVVESKTGERVLKCGVNGYGTRQERLKAEKIVSMIKSKPSLIIVGYFIGNDLEDDYLFPRSVVFNGYQIDKIVFKNTATGQKIVNDDRQLK